MRLSYSPLLGPRYTALGLALCLSLAGNSHAQSIPEQISALRVELIQAQIDNQDERAKTLEQQIDALQARQNAQYAQGSSAADYNALAARAIQQEEYALALQYYQKFLIANAAEQQKRKPKMRYSPEDATVYGQIGEAHLKLGNTAQALKAYSYAVDTMRKSINELTVILKDIPGMAQGKQNHIIQALEQEYQRLVQRGQEIRQGQTSAPESNPNPLDPSLLTQYAGPKAQ